MDETITKVRHDLDAAKKWAQSLDVTKELDAAKAWLQSVKFPADLKRVQEHVQTSCHPENIKASMKAASQHPQLKQITYGLLLVAVSLWALVALYLRVRRKSYPRPSTPELEKAPANLRNKLKGPDRKPGGKHTLPYAVIYTLM